MHEKICQAVKAVFEGENGTNFSTVPQEFTESVEKPVDECRISRASV